MKNRQFIFILFVFLACLLFCSCSERLVRKGLDELYNSHEGISELGLSGDLFMTKAFMDKYQYEAGDFHFEYYAPAPFKGTIERSFAWLSYDAETYFQAKEEMLTDRRMTSEALDGKTAFDFTFYLNHTNRFPYWFTAFGCNDETHTLVFIGIYVGFDSEDYEFCSLAETNLEMFIRHFYGEWYDWDSFSE